MSTAVRLWLTAGAILATVACRDGTGARAGAGESVELDGEWEVEMHLERPLILMSSDTMAPTDVRGRVVFVRNRSSRYRYASVGIPDYHGTYEIDFTPFGFTLHAPRQLPTAIAARSAVDSVTIALNPADAAITLLLRGSMRGDSVAGTWTAVSRSIGGGGTFVLRRT